MERSAVGTWEGLARIALVVGFLSSSVTARAADPAVSPIALVLHSESSELSFDTLAHAVSEELGAPSVAADSPDSAAARGVLTITYRPRTKELVVSYSDRARGTVTRVVPAPERVAEVAGFAALVAGNLVRDQAAELLPAVPAVAPALQTTATAAPPVSPPEMAASEQPPKAPPPVHWRGNASLFYPLATNLDVPELETNFDFNLLYGHIGALNGLELGMVSTVSRDAQGVQVSGLTNLVGGQVRAGQFSSLFNRGRRVDGVQVALVNRSDEAMQGLQLGALNLAGSLSQGAQLGAFNSSGNFEGVQIGVINVGKRVRGMQVGLINVADDVDGAPIGLISVSKTGGVHPLAWSSTTTYANLAVKFATRYTYTMLGGAIHYDGGHDLYGAGFTIGGSIPVSQKIATEIDVQALHLFADASCTPQTTSSGAYYPQPEARAQGSCAAQTSAMSSTLYQAPRSANEFTSANSRAYDQSLAKLRALLRFEIYSHLSLFVGTGVTGQVTYPVVNGDTQVKFRLLPEFFGGVQL